MNEAFSPEPPPEIQQEFEELLRAFLEGNSSQDAERRVKQIIAEYPAAGRQYLEWIYLHVELGRLLGQQEPALPPEAPQAAPRPAPVSPLTTGYWRTHPLRFATLALVLTVLLWVGFIYMVRPTSSGPGGENAPASGVAQITDMRNPTWAEGAETFANQAALEATDKLELAAGYVEIRFEHGAVVLLEGPAEFTIDTRGAGTLEHGRLVARMENSEERPGVVPFSIVTPLAQIIDVGTEFGVHAELEGATHVEVFDGFVEASPRGSAVTRRSSSVRLGQGQSVRIAPGQDQFVSDQEEQYVRDLPEGEIQVVELEPTNWRSLWMALRGTTLERITVNATHTNYELNSLLAFDVSDFYGATALGPGRLTLTAAGGSGIEAERTFDLELRQLNRHNAEVDLNAASEFFLDGDKNSGATHWRDNTGASLESLSYADSLLDITTALLSFRKGPFPGDTPTTEIQPGSLITLTIPRATLQSWFDQRMPAIVVLDLKAHGSHESDARVGTIEFGGGEDQPLPKLRFDVDTVTSTVGTPEEPSSTTRDP